VQRALVFLQKEAVYWPEGGATSQYSGVYWPENVIDKTSKMAANMHNARGQKLKASDVSGPSEWIFILCTKVRCHTRSNIERGTGMKVCQNNR
jgi:hypothetical protein